MNWREWRFHPDFGLLHVFGCDHQHVRPCLQVTWTTDATSQGACFAAELGLDSVSKRKCDTMEGCRGCYSGCQEITVWPFAQLVPQCPDCGWASLEGRANVGQVKEYPTFRRGAANFWHDWTSGIDPWSDRARAEWADRYALYLQSPEWSDKRQKVLQRAQGLCEACLGEDATEVHHLTYDHVFDEPLFDLVAVCGRCHRNITAMDKERTARERRMRR